MIKGDASISERVQGLAFFVTPFGRSGDRELSQILQSIANTYALSKNDFTKEIEVLDGLSDVLSISRTDVKLLSFGEESPGVC